MTRARRKAGRSDARRIQSIEVGFRLVKVLEAADGYLSLKEVAEAAGMSSSKAYPYLVSFMREGFVAQDRTSGYYGLGPFAIQIGLSAIRQIDVVSLARNELDSLSRATGCTAYVSTWSNRGPVILAKVESNPQNLLTVRVGYVFPLLGSATGQVFLAYRPAAETAPLLAREEVEGVGNEARRLRLVETIRRRGYAASERRMKADILSFSAPVFDYSGTMAAAITILGSLEALKPERRKHALNMLLQTCSRLSKRQGGVFQPAQAAAMAAGGDALVTPDPT